MQACERVGLLVPEEVAVLGAEDDAIRCEFSHRPLSSVVTNRLISGFNAAELLDRLMSGERVAPVRIRTEPARVIARQSTDILAIEDRAVASALGYIRDNACMGISVANVLEHVAVSRSQLERKFRRYIGRSPKAEIREVRIARAKQLLSETAFPLRKIAGLVGFEHAEYLSVFFKRSTSQSPGAYRRHIWTRTGQRLLKPALPRIFAADPGSVRGGHSLEGASDASASGEWLDAPASNAPFLRVVGG
jgi:LacI family transcriptional regulator